MINRCRLVEISLLVASLTSLTEVSLADDLMSILDGKGDAVVMDLEKKTFHSLISDPSPEQRIFLGFLNKGEWDKALYQWPEAFEKSEFAKTPSGRALWAYLLFRNGLVVYGMESLFEVEDPGQIKTEMLALWKEAAQAPHPVWRRANVVWKDSWTQIFGESIEIQVRSRQVAGLLDVAPVEALLRKTAPDTEQRAWVEWVLVLALSQSDESARAAKLLRHLIDSPKRVVGTDHLHITAARLLFEKGFLDPAIDYYGKVSKNSDFWIESQEEMSWSYLRKGQPQNAIAKLQTLMTPLLRTQIGPEPVYLKSLAHLKVCDYPAVAELLKEFRQRFQPRAQSLQKLAGETTPAARELLNRLKKGRIGWTDLGVTANDLPRFVTRDEILFELGQSAQFLEEEEKIAGELYARSLANGTGRVGFQASLDQLKETSGERARKAESAFYLRVSELARAEVNEIHQVLQKMHIVEAEVLQQVELAGRVMKASTGDASLKKSDLKASAKETLKFPFDGELWLDELSNYRVDLKGGCQLARAKENP